MNRHYLSFKSKMFSTEDDSDSKERLNISFYSALLIPKIKQVSAMEILAM